MKNTVHISIIILSVVFSLCFQSSGFGKEVPSEFKFVSDENMTELAQQKDDLTYLSKNEITTLVKDYARYTQPDGKNPSPDDNSPHWIVSGANYEGWVEKDSAFLTADIELFAYSDKVFRYVPPFTDVVIKDVQLDGKTVKLNIETPSPGSTPPQKPWLTIKGTGRHTLSFDIIAPVSRFENIASLSIKTHRAPFGTLSLTVDEAYAGIDLVPSANLRVSYPGKNTTKITANLPVHNSLFVKWNQHTRKPADVSPRAHQEPEVKPLLFNSTVASSVLITETTVEQQSTFSYEIKQGELKQLEIDIPDTAQVVSVSGANIYHWEATNGLLNVHLETAYSDSYTLDVKTIKALSHEQIKNEQTSVVTDHLQGTATRGAGTEKGYISLSLKDEGELVFLKGERVTRVDPGELKGRLSGRKCDIAAKFIYPKWKLPFSIVRKKKTEPSRITVASSSAVIRIIKDGPALVEHRWTLTNSGEQFLPVTLPEGSALMSCFVKGEASDTGLSQKDNSLKIPLTKSEGSRGSYAPFEVRITYACWIKNPKIAGTLSFSLAKIPYLIKSSKAELIGPSGYVLASSGGSMKCKNTDSLTRWYREFSDNPVFYFMRPALMIAAIPFAPVFFQDNLSSAVPMAQKEAIAPMASGVAGGAYPQEAEELADFDDDSPQRIVQQRDFKKAMSSPVQLKEEGYGGQLAQVAADEIAIGEDKADTSTIERAKFMASMKKSSASRGNLPVRIDISQAPWRNSRLSFTQELLTPENNKQTIQVTYCREIISTIALILSILIPLGTGLMIFERISRKRSCRQLIMILVVLTIINGLLMNGFVSHNLFESTLYALYFAIPLFLVRKVDIYLTKTIVGYRERRNKSVVPPKDEDATNGDAT